MSRKFTRTFSDIVAEVRVDAEVDRNRGHHAIRPGTFNLAGELFDPNGIRLTRLRAAVTPAHAAELVRAGASFAFEGCGCGGSGGCEIEWFLSSDVARAEPSSKPKFVKGHGAPTWIDLWTGDNLQVVFAHGDVTWGSVLS